MRERRGVQDHRTGVGAGERLDQRLDLVGLHALDRDAKRWATRAQHVLELRQGGRAVDLGLAGSQAPQVRPVEHEHLASHGLACAHRTASYALRSAASGTSRTSAGSPRARNTTKRMPASYFLSRRHAASTNSKSCPAPAVGNPNSSSASRCTPTRSPYPSSAARCAANIIPIATASPCDKS